MSHERRTRIFQALLAGALASTALVGIADAAIFASHGRGPNPTVAVLEATTGPYATSSYVPSASPGYGAGTVYYPAHTSDGPFAMIAVSPGYTATQSSIAWYGPRLASHGFVVVTIDTNSPLNFPPSRANQLIAALDHVAAESATTSPISGLVDPERRGVMGHSMGGGGSLIAARDDDRIDAAIPLAPWSIGEDFAGLTSPTLVMACENDVVAPTGIHAEDFYDELSGERAYLEVADGSHSCVNTGNVDQDLLGKYAVAWMKRWLDLDLRYGPYLCGPLHDADLAGNDLSDYRESCTYDTAHTLTPGGVLATEGGFGFTDVCVPITLDRPAEYPVRVDWTTFDNGAAGIATAGADYIAASGQLVFAVGDNTACAPITLVGDEIDEPPALYGEWLPVAFSNASPNGAINLSFFGLGLVIIVDDD